MTSPETHMPALSSGPQAPMAMGEWFPFPVEPGAFRLTMGLTAITPDQWLYPGPDRSTQMAERHRLIREQPDQVMACLTGAEVAAGTLWRLVNPDAPPKSGLAALAAMGQDVQEDFCIMQKPSQQAGRATGPVTGPDTASEDSPGEPYRLTAAILCFPNRWSLADKLGQTMAGIHRPVPGYDQRLARPVERFLDHIKPGRIARRHNWSLHADDVLYHPHASDDDHDKRAAAITPEHVGDKVFMRVERQTLRRVEGLGLDTVVFTIRTLIAPLAAVITDYPGRAGLLDNALTTMPPAMRQYKAMAPMLPAIHAWLGKQ
ncbi:MAG: DUF3445 domain-containing protein [Pseudomonadota bacterium]